MTQIHAKIMRNAIRIDELQDAIEALLGRIRSRTSEPDDNSLTYHAIHVLPGFLQELKEKRTELIRLQSENQMLQGFLAELGITDIEL